MRILPIAKNWPNFTSRALAMIQEPLYANTLFLLAGQFSSAIFYFFFWQTASRLYEPAAVGIASATNAAISLILVIGELGLGISIVRYAAGQKPEQTRIVNAALALRWITILLLSGIFVLGIPYLSPGLLPIRERVWASLAFVLFSVINGLLMLHISAMLAQRRASFFFWRAIFVPALGIILVWLLVRSLFTGFLAIFLAYQLPILLFVFVSSLLVLPRFYSGIKLFGHFDRNILHSIMNFATANYVADALWEIPMFVLPLLAVSLLSAEAAGYFYMPWIVGNLSLSIVRAGSSSLVIEGMTDQRMFWRSARRTAQLSLLLMIPSIIVLWVFGYRILSLFGTDYINIWLLRVILISSLAFLLNTIYFSYLRIYNRLRSIVGFSVLFSSSCIVLAAILAHSHGVLGLGLGWLVAQLICASVALIWFVQMRARFLH